MGLRLIRREVDACRLGRALRYCERIQRVAVLFGVLIKLDFVWRFLELWKKSTL